MNGREHGQLVRRGREAWGLEEGDLAALACLDVDEVREAESGEADLGVLGAIAWALGGSLEDLLDGHEFWQAPAAAFRTAPSGSEILPIRGALLRVAQAARARTALGQLLELPNAWLDASGALAPVSVLMNVPAQAEELAERVRGHLRLGLAPIASIRELMGALGIATFLSDFGTKNVDAMLWRDAGGQPCAAVNIRARNGKTTAMRMSFAHELCHALFDGSRDVVWGLVERRSHERSDALERRANAFAAHFLAPQPAVLAHLRRIGWQESEVPSAQHLRSLSAVFGMGVEAMAWHLVSCRLWTAGEVSTHSDLVTIDTHGLDDAERQPTPAEEMVPLERRGEVLDRAISALSRGLITTRRFCELIGIGPDSSLHALLKEREVDRDLEYRKPM